MIKEMRAAGKFEKDVIVTDVGSTKSSMHKNADLLGLSDCFIGGHPMAGSEKTGYENSYADLLKNRYYFLTGTEKVDEEKVKLLESIVETTGANIFKLNPDQHDRIVTAVSHLPHIASTSLVNSISKLDMKGLNITKYGAGGYRDMTRIAMSSPDMWENICHTNKESICEALDIYIEDLKEFRAHLEAEDRDFIKESFEKARSYKNEKKS